MKIIFYNILILIYKLLVITYSNNVSKNKVILFKMKISYYSSFLNNI